MIQCPQKLDDIFRLYESIGAIRFSLTVPESMKIDNSADSSWCLYGDILDIARMMSDISFWLIPTVFVYKYISLIDDLETISEIYSESVVVFVVWMKVVSMIMEGSSDL